MSYSDFLERLRECGDIVDDIRRLNDLLHNAEFVVNKMKKVFYCIKEPSLALTLDFLRVSLEGDKNIATIFKEECGEEIIHDPIFPFLLLYCSIILFAEYEKIQRG